MQSRIIKLWCKYCKKNLEESVDFGCFLTINDGTDAYILKEAPGRVDLFIKDVICPDCGCCSGLSFQI